jgi:nucleoside-diphosphate-sugar epimerase
MSRGADALPLLPGDGLAEQGASMNDAMTVAVTGVGGFVGRYLVRELLERGFRVRGLVRDAAKARAVLPRGVTPERLVLIEGDVLDGGEGRRPAEELVRGAEAVVNLIGILREGGGQTFQGAHVGATRALVEAARVGGVRRFVQMSALGVHDDGKTAYQRTKFEAETIVRRSGLDWTIFRPALIHGPDGEFIQMAKGWVTGQKAPRRFLPYFTHKRVGINPAGGPMGYGDPKVQPVAVEDVARAFVAALERPEAIGEVYNLVGSETLTWPELLVFLRDRIPGADRGLEPRGIPSDLAAAGAKVAGMVGLGGVLPFDEGMAVMGGMDVTASLWKVKAQLGLEPRGFREVARGYAGAV